MIFEVSKKQNGVNQEIYDKAMTKGDFHKNLSQSFEARAEQNLERENRSQNQNRDYRPGR